MNKRGKNRLKSFLRASLGQKKENVLKGVLKYFVM